MRIGLFICITALAAALVNGEEPPLPLPESDQPPPSQATSPSPTPPPELIPRDILSATERAAGSEAAPAAPPPVSQLDEAFKEKPISAGAEQAQRRAEWRELRNRVANDADIKAARVKADRAKTDLQKRTLLRAYYELYFGRMIALAGDPGLKAYLTARKNEHLAGLPQPRVRPSPSPASSGRSS